MCTCALVSSAISAAFSPPHMPARSFGGLSPVGSHGPMSVAATTKVKPALVTMTPLRPLIALGCLGLTVASAQQRPLAGLDSYVAKAMTDWRVPGLAIVV